jgi:hypothetical protein
MRVGQILCKRHGPLVFERTEALTEPKVILSFVNTVSKLNAGNRNGCRGKRFESRHRRDTPLDRSMVLLNDVVKVPAAPRLDVSPTRMLPAQQPQGSMTRNMPIQGNLAGTRGAWVASVLQKNALAAAMPRSGRSRKSTVLPCLSTARYK